MFGWRTKVWHFDSKNEKYKHAEMKAWCRRWRHKYSIIEESRSGSFVVLYAAKLQRQKNIIEEDLLYGS